MSGSLRKTTGMVSLRNFFSICTMMAVLFFMFQFFQLFKESGNVYDVNVYADGAVLSGAGQWKADEDIGAPVVLFVGKKEGNTADVVRQWCFYTKRRLISAEGPEELAGMPEAEGAEMLLIDGAALDFPEQEGAVIALMDLKVMTVFLTLPDPGMLKKCGKLCKALGIVQIRDQSAETEGLQIYSGFLLGGAAEYRITEEMDEKQQKLQDMELSMPWYQLGIGTKVYMTGLFDEDEIDRELFPPVIWRSSYNGNSVFAVNGDYMTQLTGIGILDGFCYEGQDYCLYPVINAENVTAAGFPALAEENAEKIMELYSRSPGTVQQDVMWPGIYALADKNRQKFTFFFETQYDYEDDVEPSGDNLAFFLRQMREIGAEAGRTLEYGGNITLAEKLARDGTFWEENAGTYRFCAYYAGGGLKEEVREALDQGGLADVRTIVTGYQSGDYLVSYYDSRVTRQSITGQALEYSFTQDLQRRSLETALGYYNLLLDLKPPLWPQSKDDQWENYFDVISSNIGTYWSPQNGFDSTTLTESDSRIRNFLNLGYTQSRQGDVVSLKVEGTGEAWFLFRTHGERIREIQGGEYRELEENAYLIHTHEPDVQLQLEKETGQNNFYFST